ncbi:hypothetical protein [Embleya sp. NPDC059237]|uniref:hypothetical protein n=1 Tax=Embleya sp. NPDC059237 TaxID=3346784 RepID=UPI003686D768
MQLLAPTWGDDEPSVDASLPVPPVVVLALDRGPAVVDAATIRAEAGRAWRKGPPGSRRALDDSGLSPIRGS